mmetsp:Transcript_7304/g.20761  ORF Transcript_7304/g.20761 Transcript_7304/m.20761 type:complete len:209 (+) Transcript_7304:3087-3713(+)
MGSGNPRAMPAAGAALALAWPALQRSKSTRTRGIRGQQAAWFCRELKAPRIARTSPRSTTADTTSTSPSENWGPWATNSELTAIRAQPSKYRRPPSHPRWLAYRYTPPDLETAARMRSARCPSLRSRWWLPLPLVKISTPSSPAAMWGAAGVKSSSQLSGATTVSFVSRAASPNGHARCPEAAVTSTGSRSSSSVPGRCQGVNQRLSR